MDLHGLHADWLFLLNHPKFVNEYDDHALLSGLSIEVVKVDPLTECIDDDEEKNIATRIWLEYGPFTENTDGDLIPAHDINLDCGGSTFEEAIMRLVNEVKEHYGDYE